MDVSDEIKERMLDEEIYAAMVLLAVIYPPGCSEMIVIPEEGFVKKSKNRLTLRLLNINLYKLIVKLKRSVFMKKFLLVLLAMLMLSFIGCATMQANQGQEKSLDQVQNFPGMKKDVIFSKSLSFIARKFNSANDVIQLKDPVAGQIICKGIGSIPDLILGNSMPRAFSYTMIIDVKDNKIRTRFENITSQKIGDVMGPDMALQWNDVKSYFLDMKGQLYLAIGSAKSDDNW